MMKTILLLVIFLVLPTLSMACPNCAGSNNAQDKYTVYILASFILLTYIPFYLIYKTATKYRKK